MSTFLDLWRHDLSVWRVCDDVVFWMIMSHKRSLAARQTSYLFLLHCHWIDRYRNVCDSASKEFENLIDDDDGEGDLEYSDPFLQVQGRDLEHRRHNINLQDGEV